MNEINSRWAETKERRGKPQQEEEKIEKARS